MLKTLILVFPFLSHPPHFYTTIAQFFFWSDLLCYVSETRIQIRQGFFMWEGKQHFLLIARK